MNLNDFLRIDKPYSKKFNYDNEPVLDLGKSIRTKNTKTNSGTILEKELNLLPHNSDADYSLLALSEPSETHLSEEDIDEALEDYINCIKEAQLDGLPIIHIVTNMKWYSLFQELILEHEIDVYVSKRDNLKLENLKKNENILVNEDYTMPSSFIHYTNEINNNILLDLTEATSSNADYSLDLDKLVTNALKFDQITILMAKGAYLPQIKNSNIKVLYIDQENSLDFHALLNTHTYVYIYNNKQYNNDIVKKVLFYAANSMVVYTNYNYVINNILPSVILNLNKTGYSFVPLENKDAFDILNENRNTVMYHFTLINVLSDIYSNFGIKYIEKIQISSSDDMENNYFETRESADGTLSCGFKDKKYDLEQTLLFPIVFLDASKVIYKESYVQGDSEKESIVIPDYTTSKVPKHNDKKLSMIVPIHNNGKYLKFKCYQSIKRLTCFEELEIIFVDDGSTDQETLRIVDDILLENREIVYKKFPDGSGSASRPRNEGMSLASTDLITFLDPDNEAVSDGFSVLLEEIEKNPQLDMVVGNIVREDNLKRNEIRYYDKAMKVASQSEIADTRQLLIQTNLTVQSIQALVVKKAIVMDNKLKMVEGAAGQDTLFFQELLLNCDTIKVVDHMIHSYYAYVEGSVTNTVSHRFFEKFYKVELERIKFLKYENLIEEYMNIKFNFYFKNWYLKKYKSISSNEEKEKSKHYLLKILSLYENHARPHDINLVKEELQSI